MPFGRPDIEYDLRGPARSFFHNTFPASITGIPGHSVENVILANFEIVYPGRGNTGLAFLPLSRLNDVPEAEADYPEFHMFGELPAWAFYVRHVKDLTMKNISVKAEAPDYRPAFVFDDVQKLQLSELKIIEDRLKSQVILKDVNRAEFDNSAEKLVKTLEQ
ncbi:MAG: hypothetical protein DWQ10_11220 [Calditrichaeota bacterium]|nr:MAG: hypothetical protein DWQ10_11220 [Calditrichota bacterium]